MKYLIVMSFVICLCSGCTALTPPRTLGERVWNSDCETVECLLEKYDEEITNNPESTGARWLWMEGYKDTPVSYLYEIGALKIKEMSLWWRLPQTILLTWASGKSTAYSGINGDIYSCEISYMPDFNWKFWLTHELMHCQGYMEGGYGLTALIINKSQDDYTDNQKLVMKKENVIHWYDTSVYKHESHDWHNK